LYIVWNLVANKMYYWPGCHRLATCSCSICLRCFETNVTDAGGERAREREREASGDRGVSLKGHNWCKGCIESWITQYLDNYICSHTGFTICRTRILPYARAWVLPFDYNWSCLVFNIPAFLTWCKGCIESCPISWQLHMHAHGFYHIPHTNLTICPHTGFTIWLQLVPPCFQYTYTKILPRNWRYEVMCFIKMCKKITFVYVPCAALHLTSGTF
jgi:hypothetical protein